MRQKYDDDDSEHLENMAEYERYMKSTPGAYEDFDEWLELEHGSFGNKTFKRKESNKTINQGKQEHKT